MMGKPAFTPGPWTSLPEETDRLYIRVRGTRLGERYKIANALFVIDDKHEKREALANARLIAAAPELYEALADAESIMSSARLELNRLRKVAKLPEMEPAALNVAVYRAKTALAKARGEQ